MKKKCDVCGEKLNSFNTVQLSDGAICKTCDRLSNRSAFASVNEIKAAWIENKRRFQEFNTTMRLGSFGTGFIFVDRDHQYFYLSNAKKPKIEPPVFSFSEIEEYELAESGRIITTKTKTKGGIGRAVVGGALFGVAGAVVGSATAKKESISQETNGAKILNVSITAHGLKTVATLINPPQEVSKIMDSMIDLEP